MTTDATTDATTETGAERGFPASAREGIDSDYFLLEELIDDDSRAVRDRVRAFVDRRLLPVINDYWERAEFPFELIPNLAELGIAGSRIEGHGCPGLGPLAAGLATLELSRGDGSINTFLGVQSGLAMGSIDLLGSQEQKQRWLPDMAALRRIGAFALTEPEHGSDSVALETSARRDGQHWVLDGQKRWIGNASMADVIVVWARDRADGAVKAFIVERGEDGRLPEGFETEVITGKIGKRAILQPDIRLRGVRVPVENRLEASTSFRDVSAVLARTRGGAGWEATGHAVAAFELAGAYATRREQFGRPIGGFQLVQNKLATMLAELSAMQLMCFRMAQMQAAGTWSPHAASIVKMSTARKGRWICSEARDILGGNGLLLENHVARHLTDMEVVHTYEGTDSIQSLILGRRITGISAFR